MNITNDKEYRAALAEIEKLWVGPAPFNWPRDDRGRFSELAQAIDTYEREQALCELVVLSEDLGLYGDEYGDDE